MLNHLFSQINFSHRSRYASSVKLLILTLLLQFTFNLLDLRSTPQDEAIQQWLKAGHGQRWFGGYGVTDDCDQRTQGASQLLPTYPIEDFDGMLFVSETRAAEPIDRSLILPTP